MCTRVLCRLLIVWRWLAVKRKASLRLGSWLCWLRWVCLLLVAVVKVAALELLLLPLVVEAHPVPELLVVLGEVLQIPEGLLLHLGVQLDLLLLDQQGSGLDNFAGLLR